MGDIREVWEWKGDADMSRCAPLRTHTHTHTHTHTLHFNTDLNAKSALTLLNSLILILEAKSIKGAQVHTHAYTHLRARARHAKDGRMITHHIKRLTADSFSYLARRSYLKFKSDIWTVKSNILFPEYTDWTLQLPGTDQWGNPMFSASTRFICRNILPQETLHKLLAFLGKNEMQRKGCGKSTTHLYVCCLHLNTSFPWELFKFVILFGYVKRSIIL